MSKKNIHNKTELPPLPILFDKDKLIKDINNKLVEDKSGNYLIKLIDLKDGRRSFLSYEYHYDIIIHVTNLNNPNSEKGLIVPGMGPNPIDLNTNRKLLPNNFFDFNDFKEVLFDRLLQWQKCINEEGYYAKEKR